LLVPFSNLNGIKCVTPAGNIVEFLSFSWNTNRFRKNFPDSQLPKTAVCLDHSGSGFINDYVQHRMIFHS